jgi:hypothetical protein
LEQEAKKILEKMREQAQSARTLSNFASFSGVAAIPFLFIGVIVGSKLLAISSLCWLVSHFIGYMTRMIQDEHKQALNRLYLTEATFSAPDRQRQSPFPDKVSLN